MLTLNTGGCSNCAAAVLHILNRFAAISPISFDRTEETLRIPPHTVSRVTALLLHSGWNVSLSNPTETESTNCNCGDHEPEDNLFLIPEPKTLEHQSKKSHGLGDIHPTQACPDLLKLELVAVLSAEVECAHTHWVPAWSVLVPRGPLLDRLYQQLSEERPVRPGLRHLKRIDSCRNLETDDMVPLFVDLAEPSFRSTDARRLVQKLWGSVDPNNRSGAWRLIPSWVPLYPPITKKHQMLYACANRDLCQSSIIHGWPTTIHTNPELEKLIKCESYGYFSESELSVHRKWLKRVQEISEDRSLISQSGKQSCCGLDGPPCTAIIVDPNRNISLAEAVTPLFNGSHLDHAIILALSQIARMRKTGDEVTRHGYLCTGLDVYVSVEPCLMCAAAILHNRARRVFCGSRLPGLGGFTNRIRIHVERKLNHRFQVFVPRHSVLPM